MARLQRTLRILSVALGLAALAVAICSQASVFHVQDDAYMYARYAANLLRGDGLAWNPGGEPTYGATALLYVPWVASVSAFLPGDPGRAIVGASLLGMLVALGLIALLLARSAPSAGSTRGLVVCIGVAVAAFAHRKLAAHATNGMDTGFSMASLALLLLAWWKYVRDGREPASVTGIPTRSSRAFVVCASWLAFAARPDLGLYTIGIPLLLVVLAPSGKRGECAKLLAASFLLVSLTVALAWWYFGVPVPLSFYIKSLATSFGEPFLERHASEAREHFGVFLRDYAPLWIFAVFDLPSRWRARAEREHALWLAVFAATLLQWMYYRFGVLQVIAFHQRFYYPTLPALFFLGVTSLARVLAIWPERRPDSALAKFAVGACIIGCTLVSGRALQSALLMLKSESVNRQLARFDLEGRYDIPRARMNWFALDGFSRLKDDLVIATTEVGLPSAMSPRKRIIDLVGLNENGFARHGFDAHRLCAELRPDVIYMPHPDYTTMTKQLTQDATFRSDYVLFPAAEIGAFMGLALNRNSAHFAELQAIVDRRKLEGVDALKK